MTPINNSPHLLFILANAGAGGHRLGRIISCIDKIFWYSSENNGISPWDIFFDDVVSGKNISPYHYDRIINDKPVPLLGERIERWWKNEDIEYFYKNVWNREFLKNGYSDILEKQYIHWVLHEIPEHLTIRFPNAKIISLIDENVEMVAKRYIETTARFPINLKLANLKPDYLSNHGKIVEELKKKKENPNEYDLWLFSNPNDSYEEYVFNMLNSRNKKCLEFDHPNYLKISWNCLDIDKIIDFLGATSIHENYKKFIIKD